MKSANRRSKLRTRLLVVMPVLLVLVLPPMASPASSEPAFGISTATTAARRAVAIRDDIQLSANSHITAETPPELLKLGWRLAQLTEAEIGELQRSHPGAISEDTRVAVTQTPDDPDFNRQWGHVVTRTDQAWNSTTGSDSQVIAMLDTGVDPVSELAGRILGGYNVLDGTANTADDHGHGTAATTVAAAMGNNAQLGAGVCWSCKILPVKVLDQDGQGTSNDVAIGIVWAVDHGASIISLSLGGPEGSAMLHSAIDYAIGRGAVVVAAAGNDGATTPYYPAAYPEVVSVGGVDVNSAPYSWSNRGPWVDVQAPGCNLTQVRNGTLASFCGTSSATPYVAGAIALRRSATAALHSGMIESPSYLEQIIKSTADDPNPATSAAHGLMNTRALLDAPTLPIETGEAAEGTGYHPLNPARILDTRTGLGTYTTAKVGPGQTLWLQVGGEGGVPASGASAVSINLTATESTTASFLAVQTDNETRPATSVLNLAPNRDMSNAVVTRVGPTGLIGIYNHAGATHLVVDVNGWFDSTTGGSVGSVLYNPLTPTRILDTRTGPGPNGQASGSWRLRAGQTLTLQVAGRGGIPADAAAAALNLTVTNASNNGHITAWPSGVPRSAVSSANFSAATTVANSVTMPLSTHGKLSLLSPHSDVDIIVDTAGYFSVSGYGFTPTRSIRLLDTRTFPAMSGRLSPGTAMPITFSPSTVPPDAAAVVSKVTITEPTASGYATTWPADAAEPVASVLNWKGAQTVTNLVHQKLSGQGQALVSASNGYPYVIVDVFGYFAPLT